MAKKLKIIGYRIEDPELTTWNRLLLARAAICEYAVLQLREVVDDIEAAPELQDRVREWLQVSHRHTLSRREMFNYIVHLHDENLPETSWRFIIEVFPVANMFSNHILLRIDAGEITDHWFDWYLDQHTFDKTYSLHVAVNHKDDDYTWEVWKEQLKLTPRPYRLTVIDDLSEYAQRCT